MVEKLYNADADQYIFIDEGNAENLIELEKVDAENCDILIDAMESGDFESQVEIIIGATNKYAAVIIKGKDGGEDFHVVRADFSDFDIAEKVKAFLIASYIDE